MKESQGEVLKHVHVGSGLTWSGAWRSRDVDVGDDAE
jgi:hypothetical protein